MFSDFVEKVMETPICGELKQHLDELYESYAKDPEKCVFRLTGVLRGSTKNDFLIILPLLLKMYNEEVKKSDNRNRVC